MDPNRRNRKKGILRHATTSSTSENVYSIKNCDAETPTAFRRPSHEIIVKHGVTGEMFYECEACKNRYVTQRSLKIHQFTCSTNNAKGLCNKKSDLKENSPSPSPTARNNASNLETNDGNLDDIMSVQKIANIGYKSNIHYSILSDQDLDYSPKSYKCTAFECSRCAKIFTNHGGYQKHVEKLCFIVETLHAEKDLKVNGLEMQLKLNQKRRSIRNLAKVSQSPVLPSVPENENNKNDSSLSTNKCSICQKTFLHKRSLVRHLKEIHKTSLPFKCEICLESWATEKQLSLHVGMIHENPLLFHCKICQKSFVTKKGLDRHMKYIHGDKILSKCYICQKIFSSERSRDRHIKEVHKRPLPWDCKICQKTFMSKQELHSHNKNIHENTISTKCYICQKNFASEKNRDRHIKEIHNQAPWWNCNICEKTFQVKRDRDDHVKCDHQNAILPIVSIKENPTSEKKCTSRLRRTTDGIQGNREHHIKELQGCSISIICRICSRTFGTPTNLERHLKEVHKNCCHVCHKRFATLKTLNQHIKYIHENVQSFKCNLCNNSYTRKASLNMHKFRFHSIRSLQFGKCKYTPNSRASCVAHAEKSCRDNDTPIYDNKSNTFSSENCRKIRKHSNNEVRKLKLKNKKTTGITSRPKKTTSSFSCSESNCDYKTRFSSNLRRHSKSIHNNGENIFKCQNDEKEKMHAESLIISNDEVIQNEDFIFQMPKAISFIPGKIEAATEGPVFECPKRNAIFPKHRDCRRHTDKDSCSLVGPIKSHKAKRINGFQIKLPQVHVKRLLADNSSKLPNSLLPSTELHENETKKHSAWPTNDLECHVCKKNFHIKDNLLSHMKFTHENRRSFECNICEMKFNWKKSLTSHVKLIHGATGGSDSCPLQKDSPTNKEKARLDRNHPAENIPEKHTNSCVENNCIKDEITSENVKVVNAEPKPDINRLELECPPCKTVNVEPRERDNLNIYKRPAHSFKEGKCVLDSTNNSNEKMTRAKRMTIFYQNNLTENQCSLCFVTCVNSAALEGHMKRHLDN